MHLKRNLLLILVTFSLCTYGQSVSVTPVVSPSLFRYNDQITVTYDVTGKSLASLATAYIWVWIPGVNTNAKYNINPATTAADPAKFTKTVVDGKTLFSITFKPSEFFTTSISAETKLGMLLKGTDWPNGQSTDFITDIWNGNFQVKLIAPVFRPLFVDTNENINVQAETPIAANYDLFVNDVLVKEEDGVTSFSYQHLVSETSGSGVIKVIASAGTNSSETSFQYLISGVSPVAPRPTGIISGINYNATDNSKVTLCLLAPGKTSVYVRGDFSNWDVVPENIMKRDGEYFWIELTGLNAGVEYGFQYLVDEDLFLADPYSDKILDPDDQYIPSNVYPSLKAFPEAARSEKWYFNRVSIFQTGQVPYTWQIPNFIKPAKENLVIYELLIRDFFDKDHRSYQSMIDTLSYLQGLGVNAIELMPIMEFNGNESWGYNPTFMLAPDKYYGPKNKLKEFIDKCHQKGMAVILDIALNHQDMPNPYVLMDFDFVGSKPKATSKWFNVSPTHPFNVFFDMNHESLYTKQFVDTVNHYWLNEYKVDGFRFDLSKGFTQQNNPSNVSAWSAYDESRIAILKRMADVIWSHTSDAYVILEHLSVNAEEKELAEYRAAEGKGMMLWGKMTDQYNQNTMGFAQNSDVNSVLHTNRGWTVPHLVGYMESHDEERLMVKNSMYGNSNPSYNTKSTEIALQRIKAASTLFYTLPGPKMLWQFGELGYDFSINYCENGTVNESCRVSPKPVKWEYREQGARKALYNHISDLNRLRSQYDVFTNGTAVLSSGSNLKKTLILKNNPYTAAPTNTSEVNVVIVVNFELTNQNITTEFPHTGTWYDYYEGGSDFVVANSSLTIALKPGEYKLLTDFPIETPIITSLEESDRQLVSVYPNPVTDVLSIRTEIQSLPSLFVYNLHGTQVSADRIDDHSWNIQHLPAGLYIAVFSMGQETHRIKIIKK